MPSWTVNPDFFLAALFGVAMLLSISVSQAAAFRVDTQEGPDETRLSVLEDTVVVEAPNGYCIDRLATFTGRRAAFVMMASCRALTGNPVAGVPEAGGLLTASIDGRAGPFPTLGELSRFLASPQGRASLSRSGDPASMELGRFHDRRGVLFLHAEEHGGDPAMGGQSWRAIFSLDGRMVTATLRDFANQPIGHEDGFRTVEQLVNGIIAANPTQPELDRDLSQAR